MNVKSFLEHWGLTDNPFRAEEAKDDPIFKRMLEGGMPHPDFEKIFGDPSNPAAAVVFGEKGSGKTAMRIQMIRKIEDHNKANPDSKVWMISYDDLNPILDRFIARLNKLGKKEGQLGEFRLEDHMDAILSLGVTRLINLLLNREGDETLSPRKLRRMIGRSSKQRRLDLAELALLYDQPNGDDPAARWQKLRAFVGLGLVRWLNISLILSASLVVCALAFAVFVFGFGYVQPLTLAGLGITAVGGIALLMECLKRRMKANRLAKSIYREVRVTNHTLPQLRDMIGNLPGKGIEGQPLPVEGETDSRYQLTNRFFQILKEAGYSGIMVLIDRLDEPTLIKGDASKMKSIVWPLMDNKFLQQDGIGIKMLLPIELSHLLRREDSSFYQKARLDKQQMVEQLQWSGATLFDLCNQRMLACKRDDVEAMTLKTLFEDNVTSQDITDALDQMHQPRDAFKMIYQVIQEHCMNNSDQDNVWKIPRMTLEHIRREQSQRVQDLYRGLSPS